MASDNDTSCEQLLRELSTAPLHSEFLRPMSGLVRHFGSMLASLDLKLCAEVNKILYLLTTYWDGIQERLRLLAHSPEGVELMLLLATFMTLGADFSSKLSQMVEDVVESLPQLPLKQSSQIHQLAILVEYLLAREEKQSIHRIIALLISSAEAPNSSSIPRPSSSSGPESSADFVLWHILGDHVLQGQSPLLKSLDESLSFGMSELKRQKALVDHAERMKKVKLLKFNLENTLVNFGKPTKKANEPPKFESDIVKQLLKGNKMVLVVGPAQSGKSTAVEQLITNDTRKHMRIYITEQLDTKSLLGNYICGEKVGEFEWREGPLSSIVNNGGILVLENLQDAKEELLELIYDILKNRFKVRGEQVHIRDSFRIIATYSVSTEQTLLRLKDIKRASFEVAEYVKSPVTFEDVMKQYPALKSNFLISTILKDLNEVVIQWNKDPKSELKSTIIETGRFAHRVNDLYSKTFKGENPIHFSINFKQLLVHIFYDIYLAKFRLELPEGLIDRVAECFKITSAEVKNYLQSYQADLQVLDTAVKSKRYGAFTRGDGQGIKSSAKFSKQFFETTLVANLVEAIIGSCKFKDNMLLVGEAGSGKTTIVQETANLIGKSLHVYNMSQSSDVSDLIGGFKPLNAKTYIAEISQEFVSLLRQHFDYNKNIKMVSYLYQLNGGEKYMASLAYMMRETANIISICSKKLEENTDSKDGFKRKLKAFRKFNQRLDTIYKLKDRIDQSLIFKFVQGNLVNALREGDWILLDEINLAQPELLQNILPILENRSIILIEKGELKEVQRHHDFKIFGCMNPGNTVGKKELPPLIRKSFVEYFVKELEDPNEITTIIKNKSRTQFNETEYKNITTVYLKTKELVNKHLITDGFNRKPTISLRALSRAVDIAMIAQNFYPTQRSRAVVEGIYAALSSNLSFESKIRFEEVMNTTFQIDSNFLPKAEESSKHIEKAGYINIEGFLLKMGAHKAKPISESDFLMTGTVKRNLAELLRVVCHSHYPILLEGPTSAGKTSMIKFLGETSGNRVVRINNHQHTDLDEYIGSYSPDESGRLVFKEGLLVEAMRKGYWIILDELNLAKSEILEALNRLLDDNRELYIPEINEVIKPHQEFRIFATQNPLDYGGRKELSIAFRSRFFHFFIQDLEDNDLVKIIETRCKVPESRSKKLVDIMKSLRVLRSRQNIFSGKESLITIRDLIKWASREVVELPQMAINGYCLLAERLRFENEREQVRKIIIEKTLRADEKLEPEKVYQAYFEASALRLAISNDILSSVFWSKSFVRMYSLVMMGIDMSEPLLLIGETGSGKTTVAELIAKIYKTQLYTVNCHQYTESSDFLGGLRPVRNKEKNIDIVRNAALKIADTDGLPEQVRKEFTYLSARVESEERIICYELCLNAIKHSLADQPEAQEALLAELESIKRNMDRIGQLFEWVDGPLIQAMTQGGVLLIDEISLAQDSVLERLNSVLEKEKTIVISEKGDGSVQEIIAHKNFMIIATMNPSGDYGKKELTPALRNRFTEIWVEPVTGAKILEDDKGSIEKIVSMADIEKVDEIKNDFFNFVLKELETLEQRHNVQESKVTLSQGRGVLVLILHGIVSSFNSTYGTHLKPLTVRDIKSSIPFFAKNITAYDELNSHLLEDYINILLGGFKCQDKPIAQAAISDAKHFANTKFNQLFSQAMLTEQISQQCQENSHEFRIGRYSATKAIEGLEFEDPKYSVQEPIVRENLKTILMGMSLDKSIMLEGPPGVGKTSLIQFLARKVGIKFYRVNLNEQTDMIDLLGSDVPSSNSSIFSWADGILIQAMKEGAWLLLDELNMATQTVLEGLNSILDHRGSIYLPELDTTIVKHPRFRIFASQNPLSMGSGRKGLPHSFLTRFTRAWIEELPKNSLDEIIKRVYPQTMQRDEMAKLVKYFFAVKETLRSAPDGTRDKHYEPQWEFNLRDLHKLIDFITMLETNHPSTAILTIIQQACQIIILDRVEDQTTKLRLRTLFSSVFGSSVSFNYPLLNLKESTQSLPQYLNGSNVDLIAGLISEPLSSNLSSIIDTSHPVLFLYDSRSDTSVYRIEQLIYSLARGWGVHKTSPRVRPISLFSSSDLIDLIGSYEQANPTHVIQKAAASSLKGHITANEKSTFASMETFKILLTDCFAPRVSAPPTGGSLFSWQESELCKGIRTGDWVIIKGAELVNPAILERLNGLLEEKEVYINEALGAGQEVEILKKHDDFRVFIMYDLARAKQAPSRALRNRCIEINMTNYDLPEAVEVLDAHKKGNELQSKQGDVHLDSLLQSVIKFAVEPLDLTDRNLLDCEKFINIERLRYTMDNYLCHYKKFLDQSEVQTWDLFSYSHIANRINTLLNEIIKSVHYRCNFSFPHIKQPSQPNLSLDQGSKLSPYLSSQLLSSEIVPLLSSLILGQLTHTQGSPGSLALASSSSALASRWAIAANAILRENTRDDVEDGCRLVSESSHDNIRRLAILCVTCLEGKGRLAARWAPALFDVLRKHDSLLDKQLSMLEDGTRSPVKLLSPELRVTRAEGGFVSPANLCMNILYNYLVTKSSSCSSVLDRTTDTGSLPSQMWTQICKVLNKNTVLKFKIAFKATHDDNLIKQLEPAMRASLNQKTLLEEHMLSEVLKVIDDSIESTFKEVIATVDSMFLDYDLLEEDTNMMQHRLVFKSNPDKINAFLGLLSKNKYLEELGLSDRMAQISVYVQEHFESSAEVLNEAENIIKLFGRVKLNQMIGHVESLCKFFQVDEKQVKAITHLLADGNLTSIKRLARKIGRIRFDEFKLSDVNILESIDQRLERQAQQEVKPIELETSNKNDYFADIVDGEPQLNAQMEFLDEICKYAENPNFNTFVSLMDSLNKIVTAEDSILRNRATAISNRQFVSVLDSAEGIRKIHDHLKHISSQLRSQKTRHISKHQFEADVVLEASKDTTLSYFIAQTMFKLLSKSSSFLADADVQEMKRMAKFCRKTAHEWRRCDFRELEGIIKDSHRLFLSFMKSGSLVAFGDFLLPFFGTLSSVLYTLRYLVTTMPESSAGIVMLDHLTPLRASIVPALTTSHPASLLSSAAVFLSLPAPLKALERMMEAKLAEEQTILAKDQSLIRGKTFDEASRMRNLAKGVERAVRDEYTKEAVHANRDEEAFEIKKVFGIESELKEDPKYREMIQINNLRTLRFEYLKKVLQGVFIRPLKGSISREGQEQLADPEIMNKAVFSLIYFSDEERLNIEDLDPTLLCQNYCKIFRNEISKVVKSSGQKDVRKSLMLENPNVDSLLNFEKFFINQLLQFVELEANSFYKGNCAQDLVGLRDILYQLLDKVQELRKVEDLRELPSFNSLVSVVDYILSLQMKKANLNEVCILIEKLFTYILDYESMTPKMYHFPEIKEKLKEALYQFRQTERKSWRSLIFCQGLDEVLNDLEDCIQLKNALVDEILRIPEADKETEINRVKKILDVVDTFLLKTTLQRQPFRILWLSRTLKTLPTSNSAHKSGVNSAIPALIQHIMKYHLSFMPFLLDIYAVNFESVAKPIKENELLSNWHMKDMVNMRMNVNKFHKGVHRSMKVHKEILEISIEGTVYKRRRDGYAAKTTEEATAIFNKDSTDKPVLKKKTKADKNKVGDKTKPDGTKMEEEKPEVKEEKTVKVLGKAIIDKITAKSEYQEADTAKFLMSNLKLFRLVSTEKWLGMVNMEPKDYAYKNYENAVDQCNFFTSDWLGALDAMKDTKSRSNRLRVLDSYLKLLYSMGVREKSSIENWDAVRTFAICTNPLEPEEFENPTNRKNFTKAVTRMYEMVDLIHVNKSNLAYNTEVQPTIRRKMHGYMIFMTNANMDLLKKATKVVRAANKILEKLRKGFEGVNSLTESDKKRFETEHLRLTKLARLRRESGGFFTTKKIEKELQILSEMNRFANNSSSISELNRNIADLGSNRTYNLLSEQAKLKSEQQFVKLFGKLQTSISKDVAAYDAQTKNQLFGVSIPTFLAAVAPRLLPLQDVNLLTSNQTHRDLMASLLQTLNQHVLEALSSSVKWSWIGCRIMHSLIYNGFCVPKDEDNDDNQEEGSEEYDIGTGLGEGKGDENKTDQYEFEEQILGTKDQDEGGKSEDGSDKDGEDEENAEADENEKGGQEKDMENDFEGDNEEDKEKPEEKGEEDQEMDQVEEDKIEQDLWDEDNEDMDDRSEEDKDQERRDAEDVEYKENQPQEQADDQRAKEPNEKEERQANDFEAQDQPEGEEDKKPEDEDKKAEENKDDEFAEVESRSAMSSRNENDQQSFDSEKPEEEDGKEEGGEDLDLPEDGEQMDEEMNDQEDEDGEDFDDPLNKEERPMPEEDQEEEESRGDEGVDQGGQAQEQDKDDDMGEGAEQGKDNAEMKEEGLDNKKEEREKETKGGKQIEKKIPDQENKEGEEKGEDIDEEHKTTQEIKESQPKPSMSQRPMNIDRSKLAELLEKMFTGDDNDEGDEIEGVMEGEDGEEVGVKRKTTDQQQQQGQKRSQDERLRSNVEIQEEKDNKMDQEQKPEEEGDYEKNNEKDDEKGEKKKHDEDQEDTDNVEEGPSKKLKMEDINMEPDRPTTMEEVGEYMKLMSQDYQHLSESNHSWATIEPTLRTRAYNLCEELRNIFKPTKIAGLRGDFRTGKRLNMRKVISYVASNYRKDKIWLRRSDPSQRDYEICLAIDDTLSMSEKNVGYLALESLITLALALTKLEVGKINISGIRNGLHEVLPFTKPFTPSDGQRILNEFSFKFSDTMSADLGLPKFLSDIHPLFTPSVNSRLLFIVGDGRMNKELVRPMALQLEEAGVMTVYILLDRKEEKGSVLNVRSTSWEEVDGKRRVKIKQYLDDFPFRNYIIVQNIGDLTSVLVSILRDYFGRLD